MNNKTRKVCIVTDGIFPERIGGIQRHSLLLIEELSLEKEIDLHVIHPHKDKKLFGMDVKEHIIDGVDTKGVYLIEKFRYSKRVYNILQENSFDVIYAQGIVVWYKIKHVAPRLIINPHGLESFQAVGLKAKILAIPFKVIQRYQFHKAAKVVSLGGRLTDILESILPKDKIVILPNATSLETIESNRKKSFSADKLNVLFVGRLARNKGTKYLQQAARYYHNKGIDSIQFHIVGNGPLKEELVGARLPNMSIYGFVSDLELENIYREADVFLLPTLFEGMPTVILEAMKFKLPVIATDVGAVTELVDESNGLIIEKRSARAIQDALLSFLMLENQEKHLMSENSVAKVSNLFTWSIVAKRHRELFLSLE